MPTGAGCSVAVLVAVALGVRVGTGLGVAETINVKENGQMFRQGYLACGIEQPIALC
jgi:hypothetical protein